MLFHYVGPPEIAARVVGSATGQRIDSAHDLIAWVAQAEQTPEVGDLFVATFVVDEPGALLVTDRRSEHVACANGGSVRSAGELFFQIDRAHVFVVETSNQSTGYCPEPESWSALAEALDRVSIPHPGRFTLELHFRLCPKCGQRNVVKDDWFVCAVCGSELPHESNRHAFPRQSLPDSRSDKD